jgi:TctA family transporter
MAEMLELSASGRRTIAGRGHAELTGSVREGAMTVVRHPGLFLRSAFIGTCVGVIPGVGGTVASFLAYGQAVATSPDRERFGKGDIRGVLAPEAAHDAKDGGALIPMLTFGIPGSDGTAVLLGVLLLHGLVPGRDLLTHQLALVFVLIWSLFLSNWLTSILGILLVSPLARLTTVRLERLAPIGLALAAAGAFVDQQRIGDVLVAVLFGLLGYYMKRHDWPRIALVVAFLLGSGIERNLHITTTLYQLDRLDLLGRPLLGLLAVLTLVNLALPSLRAARLSRARTAS